MKKINDVKEKKEEVKIEVVDKNKKADRIPSSYEEPLESNESK